MKVLIAYEESQEACKGKRRYKSTGGYKFRHSEEVVLHG